jgi:hypothetical protein
MSYARQMLDTYPRALAVDAGMLAAAIDAITDCAQACIADTDADLGEQNVTEMIRCIRLGCGSFRVRVGVRPRACTGPALCRGRAAGVRGRGGRASIPRSRRC